MEDSPLLKMPPPTVVILSKAKRYLTGVALLLSVVLVRLVSARDLRGGSIRVEC